MSKANKKARAMLDFELATLGQVYHPPKDVVDMTNKQKARRLSLTNKAIKGNAIKLLDGAMVLKKTKKKNKRLIREQQIKRGKEMAERWQPKNLVFSGGE